MLYAVIVLFLCIIPFFIYPSLGDGIRTPKEILSILAFLSIIMVAVRRPSGPSKCGRLFLFLFWCFLFTAFNFLTISLKADGGYMDIPALFFAWKELFYIALGITVIHFISSSCDISEDRMFNLGPFSLMSKGMTGKDVANYTSKILSKVALFISVYAIIQAIGFDPIFRCQTQFGFVFKTSTDGPMSHRIVAMIGNPTILASFLAMLVPFVIYSKRYITGILVIVVLVLTNSTTGIFASIIGASAYLILSNIEKIKKNWGKSLLVVLVCIGMLVMAFPHIKTHEYLNSTGRVDVLKESWEIMKNRPLFGMGLGTYEYMVGKNGKVVSKLKNEHWKEMHNEYGQIAFSVGFIGLGLLAWFAIGVLKRFFKGITRESSLLFSSLLIAAIISMVLFPFRVAPTSFYIVIITGLFLRII